MLTYHLMTEQEKELASGWQYEGEYAIYNEPSYQEQKEKGIGFGNPKRDKNFYAYCDGQTLVGFTNILEEQQAVFIGIGVRPADDEAGADNLPDPLPRQAPLSGGAQLEQTRHSLL